MTGQHNERFADRIRAARKAKGYTQTELAAQVGVSRGRIGQIESPNAEPTYPRIQSLRQFSRALDLQTITLMGWIEEDREIVENQGNDLRSATRTIPGYVSRLASNRRPVASLLTFPGRPATVRTSVAVSA